MISLNALGLITYRHHFQSSINTTHQIHHLHSPGAHRPTHPPPPSSFFLITNNPFPLLRPCLPPVPTLPLSLTLHPSPLRNHLLPIQTKTQSTFHLAQLSTILSRIPPAHILPQRLLNSHFILHLSSGLVFRYLGRGTSQDNSVGQRYSGSCDASGIRYPQ